MHSPLLRRSLLLAGLALLSPATQAQTLAFGISTLTATSAGQQDFDGSLGLYFSLNAPLTVSSLGYWDDDLHGVTAPLTIAIFDRTATSAPVTIGGTTVSFTFTDTVGTLTGGIVANEYGQDDHLTGRAGQFRLANLSSPVVLPAGQYALVSWGFNFDNQNLNGSNDPPPVLDIASFGGRLTFDGSAFGPAGSPGIFPTNLDPNDGSIVPLYVSATFSPDAVSAIPEPASIALVLGAGSLLLGFMARRRSLRLPAKMRN